jgi:hypothetical protein
VEAFLPAFVAILLAEADGRMQHQTDALNRHYGQAGVILLMLFIVSAGVFTFAAVGGWLVIEMMNFRASSLLVGLALIFAGVSMAWPSKPVGSVSGPLITTGLWRYGVTQFSGNSSFIVFAFSAWAKLPVVTVIAGLIGTMIAASLPLVLPDEWRRLAPWRYVRWAGAAVLLLTGLWAARLAMG